LDVIYGGRWSTDDPNTGGVTKDLDGSFANSLYFDRELIDIEVEYHYNTTKPDA
jgi:hypothetical protein